MQLANRIQLEFFVWRNMTFERSKAVAQFHAVDDHFDRRNDFQSVLFVKHFLNK